MRLNFYATSKINGEKNAVLSGELGTDHGSMNVQFGAEERAFAGSNVAAYNPRDTFNFPGTGITFLSVIRDKGARFKAAAFCTINEYDVFDNAVNVTGLKPAVYVLNVSLYAVRKPPLCVPLYFHNFCQQRRFTYANIEKAQRDIISSRMVNMSS